MRNLKIGIGIAALLGSTGFYSRAQRLIPLEVNMTLVGDTARTALLPAGKVKVIYCIRNKSDRESLRVGDTLYYKAPGEDVPQRTILLSPILPGATFYLPPRLVHQEEKMPVMDRLFFGTADVGDGISGWSNPHAKPKQEQSRPAADAPALPQAAQRNDKGPLQVGAGG